MKKILGCSLIALPYLVVLGVGLYISPPAILIVLGTTALVAGSIFWGVHLVME